MKIAIANDHNGVDIKLKLIKFLEKKGNIVKDFGSNFGEKADYPNYAFSLGKSIEQGNYDLGILICGTGIGMSIACNKVKNIRCAKVSTIEEARLSKEHNNANVISLSSKMPFWKMKKIIDTFLKTSFSNEERHIRRNKMIDDYND